MKAELAEQIDSGKNDQAVVTYFVEKYGVTVLSTPPRSGFSLAAWITPFAALAVGALMVVYFVRRFRSKWAHVPAADVDLTKYQRKVEEELEKYTPED
jgi:cytochrome c-type biogenesis protein CcmH